MGDRLKQVMADVFGIPFQEIHDDAEINEVPGWDSLRHVELMLALEMNFGLHLTAYEMHDLISYSVIEQFLQERDVQAAE
jgi:acyl carrier protein